MLFCAETSVLPFMLSTMIYMTIRNQTVQDTADTDKHAASNTVSDHSFAAELPSQMCRWLGASDILRCAANSDTRNISTAGAFGTPAMLAGSMAQTTAQLVPASSGLCLPLQLRLWLPCP